MNVPANQYNSQLATDRIVALDCSTIHFLTVQFNLTIYSHTLTGPQKGRIVMQSQSFPKPH